MAVARYYSWDRAGRPLTPARPLLEFVQRMRLAFPRDVFGYYSNEAHYQAARPEDHTPFSVTGWPLPNPYPWVFATDVMHHPAKGVDCQRLFDYWIAEARAGRMPWLKYIIWQAKLYHASSKFLKAQANSGHFDHIHLSFRTDHQNSTLGTWSVVPIASPPKKEEDVPKIVRVKENGAYWISNGPVRTWLASEDLVAEAKRAWGITDVKEITWGFLGAYGVDSKTLQEPEVKPGVVDVS